MAAWTFHAPGNLQDFRDPKNWHAAMTSETRDIVTLLVASVLQKNPDDVTAADIDKERGNLAYVDPTVDAVPAGAETVAIQPWSGFPRAVERRAPWAEYPPTADDASGNFRAVEHLGEEDFREGVFVDRDDNMLHLPVRDRQDEYLEWAARRDGQGRIIKLIFVAEGYDYFATLFREDEQRVLELYKEFTGVSTLKVDDLRAPKGIYRRLRNGTLREVVKPGDFNPRNRHNINPGIVHLSQRANSLSAEVNLAGVSAIGRKKVSGALLDGQDAEELLCCNEGGDPNRNSDPLISQQAYAQVLGKYRYTLADPIGLYIAGVAEAGLLLPDNRTRVPREWWRATRGSGLWSSTSRVLRLELEVPAAEKLTISDLRVAGNPVTHSGQLAELLSVHLFVTRWKRSQDSIGPVVACTGTCCRRGNQLYGSDGTCGQGDQLAFPGLVGAPQPAASNAGMAKKPARLMTR